MIRSFRRLYSDTAKSVLKIKSSVAAGTRLKGCNVRKAGEDPVALADEEYPSWLWELLDPEAQKAKLASNPILAMRKARRQANRQKIKENNFLAKMGK